MSTNTDLAHRICDFLNVLLEVDRNAIACLIANRVPCNQALADHPTVQVGPQHGGYYVGMLGILNGLCGVKPDGAGFLVAIFDGEGNRDLLRFEVHADE